MQIQSSQGVPIFPGFVAQISTRRKTPSFGFKPFGLSGGCGCGPVGGCGCGSSGLSGLAQSPSIDSIIGNVFNWLGGTVESSLPTSAAVPPSVGSSGALITTIQQWLPYIIGGYLLYKAIK